MSSSVLPSLIGLGFDVHRKPLWKNQLQEAVSGFETAVAFQSYPRWQYQVTYNILRNDSNLEVQDLWAFFNTMHGSFDTWLYNDPDDNTVTGQALGAGTGALAAFQLVRTMAGASFSFVEPILAPRAVSAVYLAGVAVPAAGIAAPTNGALTDTAAGALAATTYFVKTTWVTNSGETLPSAETSHVTAINRVLNVAAPGAAPAGAIGWNVYVSNTAGGSGNETKQNVATIALGTPWVEPNTGLIAGTALPLTNTTGWTVSNWGAAAPGVLTFGGNVANGIAITGDFTYYFPCRFIDDEMDFNKFMYQMFACKAVNFKTVKNGS